MGNQKSIGDKKGSAGYYVYSIIIGIVIGIATIFGFIFVIYLLYDLIVKAATNQFADKAIVYGVLSLIFSVFGGAILNKKLEFRNAKRLES